MSAPAVAGYPRFHAIVAAQPFHESVPPLISPSQPDTSYEPYGGARFHDGKRRREPSLATSNKKGPKRDVDEEVGPCREPTTQYQSREDLLKALQLTFMQTAHVDFNGTFEAPIIEAASHKERIQSVANDIWKATGYRFTVKDHPQFTNGFKTRFWCSQDDAHRSKSSRAARKAQGSAYKPRVTSAGEAMAKARYPCRSRLLISSRDSNMPRSQMCILTVRMHHHVAHEPYIDLTQPPDVVQEAMRNFAWVGRTQAASPPKVDTPVEHSPVDMEYPGSVMNDDEESEGDRPTLIEPDMDSTQEVVYEPVIEAIPQVEAHNHNPEANPYPSFHEPLNPPVPAPLPTHSTSPTPLAHQPPTSQPEPEYHQRMNTHIKNLREFCDGLEYQLQFNDYRMLNVLENEGGTFLGLVAECLRKEGRLVASNNHNPTTIYPSQLMEHPMPIVPVPVPSLPMHHMPAAHHHPQQSQQTQIHHQHSHQHQLMQQAAPPQAPNISIGPPRPYNPNSGINPRALNY